MFREPFVGNYSSEHLSTACCSLLVNIRKKSTIPNKNKFGY